MSFIADALQKIETPRTSLPPAKPQPSVLWPYRLLLAAGTAAVLMGLAMMAHRAAPASGSGTNLPKESPSALLFTADRQMSLNGIVTGAGKPVALINNRVVGEGEMIRGMKLVSVLPDQVQLEKDGRTTTLKLKN